MSIFESVILGIVQGLTEFLPVSSSGHLVLLQKIFNINEPGLFFDTMLHTGTLVAVFIVLWKDIWGLIRKPIQKLTLFLIIATIPAVIAALLFNDKIEEIFKSANLLGFCFLITTCFLITAEFISRRRNNKQDISDEQNNNLKTEDKMNWIDALLIGIMQAIAILPGISRSGATISGALLRKLDRDFAARFSFLLSIPAILGALVLQTKDLVSGSAAANGESINIIAIIAGTVSAAIVGFFAVKFMLKIIREKSLFGFAIYTGVLGALVLLDQFVTRIVF
ncbi:MAG: undecaprenyl-diphosphate phosphatase [Treponema sp.]|nr:undecaprenyl-diphosphate phosphatase [Treponema sp.]MCL2252633.1 undecaprenyl-diphosphate phosphatase [Treponema sp.]